MGCDFELKKEYYSEAEPPSETHMFNLSLSSETDTIALFNKTEFTYLVNTNGLDYINGTFSMKGKEWNAYTTGGKFTIDPVDFPAGFDTLSLRVFTKSGTGSIAEHFGAEGYIVERKWLFKIDGRPHPPITVSKSVTKDGWLKIIWPRSENLNFLSYELSGSTNSEIFSYVIKDPDQNFYVDSFFIGGRANYCVSSRVITNNQYTWGNLLNLEEPYPTLQFEDLGTDSLRIFWNRSLYNAKYRLAKGSSTLFESSSDSTCKIANPGFGSEPSYTLYTSPDLSHPVSSFFTMRDSKSHTMGQRIAWNWPTYGYNSMDRTVYCNTYDDIFCYDVTSLSLLKTYEIHNLIYQGYYSSPTNSTKVAALSADSIYVFDNKSLTNPLTIPYYCFSNTIDHFCMTDNDMIAVAHSGKYQLISIAEKKVITTIPLPDYPVYSKWACITTSQDARFACVVTLNGIKVFNIENGVSGLIYSDNRIYRSALFDPDNPGHLLLTFYYDKILETRSMPDFNLISSVELPTATEVIRNIDPESGYLLLKDSQSLYILDRVNLKVVFKMKTYDTRPQLYANRLFSESGYSLDIKKYLPE